MSEQAMVDAVQQAVRDLGIEDEILAAGQFSPRGHSGSMFAGGMIGGDVGGAFGELGDAVGVAAGAVTGGRAGSAAAGLPEMMLVGVSASTVYGFEGRSRSKVPTTLVFRAEREGLEVKVHKRVNVRVLELLHPDTGSRIELEGNRLPVTHSKDVIELLS